VILPVIMAGGSGSWLWPLSRQLFPKQFLPLVSDETMLQSTYISLGVTHRLENSGSIELEMIEVQSGSYLGEDDIVRFENTYGRE